MKSIKLPKKTVAIIAFLFVAVIVCATILSVTSHSGVKRVFYFPAIGTDKLVKEVRYIPKNPVQGDVRLYVDELLLGSQLPRLRPLFSLGTTVSFFSLNDGILYVDLTDDVILQKSDSPDIEVGINLFEKNIKKNFKNIAEIKLFIGGKSVYKYSEKQKEKR